MAASEQQTIECPSRVFWVGIGCKRGTSNATIAQAIRSVFQAHNLAEDAIAGIATIDTKANEAGLVKFCRDRNLPLRYFSAEALRSVAIPNPSGVIEATVGTPSVAEAAALLASLEEAAAVGGAGRASEEQRKQWEDRLQHVLATPDTRYPTPVLCIPKQIVRNLGQAGSVTVAVARSL